MNYLAHGYRFLERPLFVAGTAVPDWLSVVNRRVRARRRLVQPVVESTRSGFVRQVGQGILQHHADDDAFHRSEAFQQMEGILCGRFRSLMPDPYDHRPGFLGHIVVELMLDAALARQHASLLDEYYCAMDHVDVQVVEDVVNQMVTQPTDRLAFFIRRFREERFLYDYMDDQRMLFRLNQVLKRVGLSQMTLEFTSILAEARSMLIDRAAELLCILPEVALD